MNSFIKNIIVLIITIIFFFYINEIKSSEICKNQLLKYFEKNNNNNNNSLSLELSITIIKNNGQIIYGNGELHKEGEYKLVNNDGLIGYQNDKIPWLSNDDPESDQPFSNLRTFRVYYGEFYIHKDGYLIIGSCKNKIEFTILCNDTIFSGLLFDDLYTIQIKTKPNNNINNNNNNTNNTNNNSNINNNINNNTNTNNINSNNIEIKSIITNSWSEGSGSNITKYSLVKTLILNNSSNIINNINNNNNITSLTLGSEKLMLRDDLSFWGVNKVMSPNLNNNFTTIFSLPPYSLPISPGKTYEFGFIIKGSTTIPIFKIF
ncbi:hypothetical protein ACTFIW_004915 [Dictyostelium discoideum]